MPPPLCAVAARVIAASGDGDLAHELLAGSAGQDVPAASSADSLDIGELALERGKAAMRRGELDDAERHYREAIVHAEASGHEINVVIAKGQVADILQARGQLDEALRIRAEEELPVYERLGDVRDEVVAQAKIADISAAKGDADEAIRVYLEEVLSAFEALGDFRLLIAGRANFAMMLLRRGREGDRTSANELLCFALADARRLRIPEADQISGILEQLGMHCP